MCCSSHEARVTLQVEMAQLGAEGVLDTPHIPDLSSAQPEQAPPAEEAIGGRVTVHFAGVGVWCRGEVLAYSAPPGRWAHVTTRIRLRVPRSTSAAASRWPLSAKNRRVSAARRCLAHTAFSLAGAAPVSM